MPVTVRRNQSDVVWSDIDSKFLTDSQGNIKVVTNIDSVIASMDNIMGTFVGERVMVPEFASRLKHLLFEPINEDMMSFLATEVKSVIESWDNRVKVIAVSTTADPDNSFVNMSIEFQVTGFQGTFTMSKVFTQ